MTSPLPDRPLPNGWRWVRLGDVCDLYQPQTIGRNELTVDGAYPVYGANGILGRYNSYNHAENEILIGCRGTCGNVHASEPFSWITGNAMVIHPKNNDIAKDYLFFAIKNADLATAISGTAQPQITRASLSPLPIPLPPLEEQRRIVARLDAQMAAADRARRAAQEMLAAAEALPGAMLREMLPPLREHLPQHWRWVTLGEVCNVVSGVGFKPQYQGFSSLPIPFIKVSDMNNGDGYSVSYAANTIDEGIARILKAKICPAGTLIFPKVGGAVYTNKKRILASDAAFDNNIMGLVPTNVSSDWLYHWFQTIQLSSLANLQALPSIKGSVVADIPIPLPPLDEQRRIVARLDEQMAAAEQARRAAQAKVEAAEALSAALLRDALPAAG